MNKDLTSEEIIRHAYNRQFSSTKELLEDFHWEDKICYTNWLIQTYHYVKHTTRLTALCAAKLPLHLNHLHQHLLVHASQEEEAHEQLILNDLKELDFKFLKVIDDLEFTITQAFYKTLYYEIDNVSPLAIFGRIIPLEGLAATLGAIITSKVSKGNSFIGTHADADPHHVERAFAAVKDVSIEEARIIEKNINFTFEIYNAILNKISDLYEQSGDE